MSVSVSPPPHGTGIGHKAKGGLPLDRPRHGFLIETLHHNEQLWDVDFKALNCKPVALVSGTRAWDMAVRLDHDEVTVQQVEPDLAKGLKQFRETSRGQVKRIYCTYTAMLALRKILSEITDVEEVW